MDKENCQKYYNTSYGFHKQTPTTPEAIEKISQQILKLPRNNFFITHRSNLVGKIIKNSPQHGTSFVVKMSDR
jgi:hypothetical protein